MVLLVDFLLGFGLCGELEEEGFVGWPFGEG